jgi:hypothetical protein
MNWIFLFDFFRRVSISRADISSLSKKLYFLIKETDGTGFCNICRSRKMNIVFPIHFDFKINQVCFLGIGKNLIGYLEFRLNKSCWFDKYRVKIDLPLDLTESIRRNTRWASLNSSLKSWRIVAWNLLI